MFLLPSTGATLSHYHYLLLKAKEMLMETTQEPLHFYLNRCIL